MPNNWTINVILWESQINCLHFFSFNLFYLFFARIEFCPTLWKKERNWNRESQINFSFFLIIFLNLLFAKMKGTETEIKIHFLHFIFYLFFCQTWILPRFLKERKKGTETARVKLTFWIHKSFSLWVGRCVKKVAGTFEYFIFPELEKKKLHAKRLTLTFLVMPRCHTTYQWQDCLVPCFH